MSSIKSAPGSIDPAFSLSERLRLLEAQINASTTPSRQAGSPLIHGLHSIKHDGTIRPNPATLIARDRTAVAVTALREPRREDTSSTRSERKRSPGRRVATAALFAILTTTATTLSLGWSPSVDPASPRNPALPAAAPASQARLLDIARSAQRLAQAASRPAEPRKVAATISKPTLAMGMLVPQGMMSAVKLPLTVTNPVGGAIVTIDGLPEGARFNQGMQIAEGSWSLPLAALETAALSLPPTTPNDVSLLVRVIGRDSETLVESQLNLNIERPRLAIASAQTHGPLPAPIARLITGKEASRAHHATPALSALEALARVEPEPGSRATTRAEPPASFIEHTAATKDVATPAGRPTARQAKRAKQKQRAVEALAAAPSKLGGASRNTPRAGAEAPVAAPVSPDFPAITAVPTWAPFQHHHKP